MAKSFISAAALVLILSLLGSMSTIYTAAADTDTVKWCPVNIPGEGETGNWVLASGSDVEHLTVAADGTIYAYASPSGTSFTLFKSEDNGSSWSPTGRVAGVIVDIATPTDNSSVIYYATAASIYKSTDAGSSFTQLAVSPGGAGSDNVVISSITAVRLNEKCILAAGTRDSDNSEYGGAYILDENEPAPTWSNTSIGNYDVLTLAFSPKFTVDRQLVAVATDETDTLVTTRIGEGGWGQIVGDAAISGLAPVSATVAFADDHDASTGDCTLWVAINGSGDSGDVYKVSQKWAPDSSPVTDLDIGTEYDRSSLDVSCLAVSGNASSISLLAGAANSGQIYTSTDSGRNWLRSQKAPSGQSITGLLPAAVSVSGGTIYAATSGTESAFSCSADGGITWNQISLIDTKISGNGLIDVAVSHNYSQDETLFLLTFNDANTKHSLWRSLNGGAKWERVLNSTLAGADNIKLVELSPQYGNGSRVVFLTGTKGSDPVIWKSTDNGQSFTSQYAPFSIDTWAAANDSTLFLGSYNGSSGLVYQTTDSGFSYSTGAVAGSKPLESIVLSPEYEQDGTIIAGNQYGQVYLSLDNGSSFKLLGQQLPLSATDVGKVNTAFDPGFGMNRTIYAASDAAATADDKERIYRFIIGRSTDWESINSNLPVSGMVSRLAVSGDGVLYAANSQSVDTANGEGGIERSLNPRFTLGPTFETVSRGLDDEATLINLWLIGNRLWAIDSHSTRLISYTDSLSVPVTLTSPTDQAQGSGTGDVHLDWETLPGATRYQWQLNYDTDFSTIPSGFEGETNASSVRLPDLDTATTYYWRVRAVSPVLNPWSAKWSFTTSLGSTVTAPKLFTPEAGDTGVPPRPIFQWGAIAGAESYELLVCADPSFDTPVILKIGDYALPATAWQSDITLDYDTTYYWKVRAKGPNSNSAWSAVAAFTSEPAPARSNPVSELLQPTPEPVKPPPIAVPSPIPTQGSAQPILPDWALYLFGALLLTIVLSLVTLLVLVLKIRQP